MNISSEIFRNDSSVFTFSMHGKGNYPFEKEKSDLDIALVSMRSASKKNQLIELPIIKYMRSLKLLKTSHFMLVLLFNFKN